MSVILKGNNTRRGIESDHLIVKDSILKEEWAIKDADVESYIKDCKIEIEDRTVPNSFTLSGRRLMCTVVYNGSFGSVKLTLAPGNCGLVVMDHLISYNQKVTDALFFLVKNICSTTGIARILASDFIRKDKTYVDLGFSKSKTWQSSRHQSTPEYKMRLYYYDIARNQMKKIGYN